MLCDVSLNCSVYLFPLSRKLNIYNQPIGIRWNVPPRLSFRNIPTSRSSRTGPSMASNRIPCIHLSHFLCITYDHLVMNAMLHVICALLPLDITRTSHYILFYALFPSTTTVTESSHSLLSSQPFLLFSRVSMPSHVIHSTTTHNLTF